MSDEEIKVETVEEKPKKEKKQKLSLKKRIQLAPVVPAEEQTKETRLENLRAAVRCFYDMQKLRIQSGNRTAEKVETSLLTEDDKQYMLYLSTHLNAAEKAALDEIDRLLASFPIATWCKEQRGVGPTLTGVLVAYVNIEKADTVSKLWRYAGLAVDTRTGQAEKRVKGEKAAFDPWFKSKMVGVLGGCMIKANSPYRKFYDDYKHRKEQTIMPVCMGCNGSGIYKEVKKGEPGKPRPKDPETIESKCSNCNGTGHNAPWGKHAKHRSMAAIRYMVKMFLLDFWKEWRTLEGLPVRPPYQEEYLGHIHGHWAQAV